MAYICRVPLFDSCWWKMIWIRCWHCFCSFENRSQAHKLLTVKFQLIRVSVRRSAHSINNSTLYCYAEFSTVMIKLFILVNLLSDFFSGVQAPRQGLCPPYLVLYPQYFSVLGTYRPLVHTDNCLNDLQSSKCQKVRDRQGSSLAWIATFSETKTWIVTLKTKPNQTEKQTKPKKAHINYVIITGDLGN